MLLHGRLDVLWRDGPRALVVDYKTNSLAERTPEEIVESDYRLQRLVYALACFRAGADEVEVVYHFLERPDAVVSTTLRPRTSCAGLEAELSAAIAPDRRGRVRRRRRASSRARGCPALDVVCAGPQLRSRPSGSSRPSDDVPQPRWPEAARRARGGGAVRDAPDRDRPGPLVRYVVPALELAVGITLRDGTEPPRPSPACDRKAR